jgi:PhnB protein
MTVNRNRLPDNTSLVMPRLVCRDAAAEMEFCRRTFAAEELNRRLGPDGSVAYGLLKISGEMIMVEGEWPGLPSRAPATDGTSPVVIFVYVPDVDRRVENALENGARVLVPLQDQFWGDRIAWFMDPAGHVWTVASRIEETTAEERTSRWESVLAEGKIQGGESGDRSSDAGR